MALFHHKRSLRSLDVAYGNASSSCMDIHMDVQVHTSSRNSSSSVSSMQVVHKQNPKSIGNNGTSKRITSINIVSFAPTSLAITSTMDAMPSASAQAISNTSATTKDAPTSRRKIGIGTTSRSIQIPTNTSSAARTGEISTTTATMTTLSTTESTRKTFYDRLVELKQFKEKYGHCNVPQGYAADPSLGHWCSHMRSSYKNFRNGKGRKLGMNEERIHSLEQLGFQWVGKHGGYFAKSFEERMADLRQFKVENGHCNVPDGFAPDPSLGQWCRNMRRGYKALKTGKGPRYGMNEERIRELDVVDFEWVAKIGGFSAKTFEDRMEDLLQFKKVHGHCNVPSRYAADPSLGQWCSQLRRGYKAFRKEKGPKRGMNEERIHQLEEVGFEWVVRKK